MELEGILVSARMDSGGRLLRRDRPVGFTFNGRSMTGFEGDTVASALLANGQTLVGRSFKYHRPRGIVASGPEEPNALLNLGAGAAFEPNQRATTTELREGLSCASQNHWPSLEFDVGALNDRLLSRFLPAGFYYKTFIHPRPFWKHVYEPFIRRSAGLGRAPKERDADTYEHCYAFADVLVVGGGVAGLHAARIAASSGARVMLLEQTPHWGGRAPVDGGAIDGKPAEEFVAAAVAELSAMPNVVMRTRTMGAAVHDHAYVLAHESVGDHRPDAPGPRHRLWRIRAGRVVMATGAIERPISFACNDVPGVMLASAVRDYAVNFGVAAGSRTVVATACDDGYLTAIALKELGLEVPAVLDARAGGGGELASRARGMGIRVECGMGIAAVTGRKAVTGVEACMQEGEGGAVERIACDAVAMAGGWSPAVHLWSHCGGKLEWDAERVHFRPDPARGPTGADGRVFVLPAGSAAGALDLAEVLADADAAGRAAVEALGRAPAGVSAPVASPTDGAACEAVWMMPSKAGVEKRGKSWLDFQNDVKVSDVELAAREGFRSVEHAKRYTTLGMATDQGKLSNINGLAILSNVLGQPIPDTGTTTFRPPYAPISLASLAGEAKGDLFQPIRRTPMHGWHEAHGAHWEPVGAWRRPYAFPGKGETVEQAVQREIIEVRSGVGLLDASTLGKLLVRGEDAGRFLDMMYTNMMSTLKPGRCRYGLMCGENGFLIDDGVVVRIDEETFLCHTTTGGADSIHAHMEEWLQTEWWDWKVYVANVTEQHAQIAVAGPKARELLGRLGADDLSDSSLPFMGWRDATVASVPVRVHRISFTGELSFELAAPASRGRELWEALMEAGAAFGAVPYGTEAMHVMRAEKGFIMIGDETDGTVIPQDLGLDWAISKKKDDYIGKRAQERTHMTDPRRWKLVGLETLDGSVLPDGAYAVAGGTNANGQRNVQGRVTSTYHSPTLGRGIAMGLVLNGPDRLGDVLDFPAIGGRAVQARIVEPAFYDREGERQNV